MLLAIAVWLRVSPSCSLSPLEETRYPVQYKTNLEAPNRVELQIDTGRIMGDWVLGC